MWDVCSCMGAYEQDVVVVHLHVHVSAFFHGCIFYDKLLMRRLANSALIPSHLRTKRVSEPSTSILL